MTNRILQFAGAAIVAAGLWAAQPALAQDKKVALVIGNSEYQNVFPLKNPVNDAADIGEALKRIGFNVTALSNAPVADMRRTLKAFGDKARLAEVAVVFYSGHALQSDGVAWLLASDGQARSLADITKGSISLPEILEQIDGVEKAGLVFIDVARNDPFNEAQKRQLPSGLKRQVEEPKNILISFATGTGRKVADGAGRNSPFTAALLKHIEQPGIELIALMKRVRDDVVSATAGEQVPAFYLSAADEAYFVAALPKAEPAQPATPAPAAPQAVAPEIPAPAEKIAEAPPAAEPAPAPVPAAPAAEAEKPSAEPSAQDAADSTENKND
ncbi:MAG: caspase family protein [Pseudomonadota bacterium]